MKTQASTKSPSRLSVPTTKKHAKQPKIVQDLTLLLEIDLKLGRRKEFQERLRQAISFLSVSSEAIATIDHRNGAEPQIHAITNTEDSGSQAA